MAELHVQRKRQGAVWVWLLLVILILAAGAFYYIRYYQKEHPPLNSRPVSERIKANDLSTTKI